MSERTKAGKPINKTAIIVALIGAIATIISAIISLNVGKAQGISEGEHNVQAEFKHIFGDVISVIGDGNEVTVNDIRNMVDEYIQLKQEKKTYTDQISKNLNDLEVANDRIKELEQQLANIPNMQFKNVGLAIEGDVIPINTIDSSVIINNRTYYSDDFINSIVQDNMNISLQDDVMYIGKIIKNKANLLDQWEFDTEYVRSYDNGTDSYGNMYSNVLYFPSSHSYITYNLNREYSLMKFKLAISEYASMDKTGTLTIKADDEVVYTSPALTRTTEAFEVMDVPINNCLLLTIEYNAVEDNDCFIFDAEIYN